MEHISMTPSDSLVNKENEGVLGTPFRNGKQAVLNGKRQFGEIKTPVATRKIAQSNNPIQTPAQINPIARQHPLLRDITNSANLSRINDVFPTNNNITKRSSQQFVESKLRITEPEPVSETDVMTRSNPQSIEELLALPDSELPDIEYCPTKPIGQDDDDFADLPLIDLSIFQHNLDDDSQYAGVESQPKKSRDEFHGLLEDAMKGLEIHQSEFDWAFRPLIIDEDAPPCIMFDDLPLTIACRM